MSNDFEEIPASKSSISKRKLVYGVGTNDAKYIISRQNSLNKKCICPYYRVWVTMLQRCYDPKRHVYNPTYLDCTVCTEWLIFSNFKNWMEQRDWEGNELDKDLLHKGNKQYSSETCVFISQEINKLINNHSSQRGDYMLGVQRNLRGKPFKARCRLGGKQKYLGSFTLESEAHEAYCKVKSKYITEIANQQTDVRIKSALLLRASEIHLQE